MRRVVTCAALVLVLSACAVPRAARTPTGSPTPPPATETAATVAPTPAVQAVTYVVNPFEVRSGTGATTKTAIFFANPNRFLVDWAMVVRLRNQDGSPLREERIGTTGVAPDRADPVFQNWYFPIPPGDSWTVVRFETAFNQSDVQSFRVTPSASASVELNSVKVSSHSCQDNAGTGIRCELTVEAATDVPALTRLHLVVAVKSADPANRLLRAMQWRPELVGAQSPWLKLGAGQKLELQFQDNYPTPVVTWRYEVFARAYQFSR